MYHYTQEQLESMKKVEASRASRIEKLHARMSAEEKDEKLFLFAKLEEVRFLNQVRPGDTVRYEIETVKATGRRLEQKGKGYIVGKVDKRGNPLVAVEAQWFCLVVPANSLTE